LVQTEYAAQYNLSNAINAGTLNASNFSGSSLVSMFDSISGVVGSVAAPANGGLSAPERPELIVSNVSVSRLNAARLSQNIKLVADLPSDALVGDSIKVLVDGAVVSSLTHEITEDDVTSGKFEYDVDSSIWGLSSSTVEIKKLLTTRVDKGSSSTEGAQSKGLLVTIDTFSKTPTIELSAGQDSNVTSDRITNTGETFTISNAEVGATLTVEVKKGGTTFTKDYVVSSSTFTANASDIHVSGDGAYQVRVKQIDSLLNESAFSEAISVIVDTTSPSVSIATQVDASLTDALASGWINKSIIDSGFTISGDVSAEDGQSVTVTLAKVGAPSSSVTLAGVVAGGKFSIRFDQSNLTNLPEGSYSLSASVKDIAGNVNTTATVSPASLSIDKTAPNTPGMLDLIAGSDSGQLNTDNITNASTGLSFSGVAEAGSKVYLYDNGLIKNGVEQTADVNGNYTFSGISLVAGSHSLSVVAKDAAGNSSAASPALSMLVDQTVPVVSSVVAPGDAVYERLQILTFVVQGSEPMYVSGVPKFAVGLDSPTPRYATYVSGSGTNALTFQYKVASGDLDTNGITLAPSVSLPAGASVKDAAGNDLALALNNISNLSGVKVNGAVVGSAVDGYLINVVIFADANNDNQITSGESVGGSIGAGVFSIPGGTGHLIMRGGEDISTGAPFSVQYEAPEGYTVINPVTTLIAQYQSRAGASLDSDGLIVFSTSNEAAAAKVIGAKLFGGLTPQGLTAGNFDTFFVLL